MIIVDVAEARERLPELLRRVGNGEELVITDGGKWVAKLAPPPPAPPTPEELAAAQARAEEAIRDFIAFREESGFSLPDGMTIDDLIEQARRQ